MSEYIFTIVAKKLILYTIPAHFKHGLLELGGYLQLVVGAMFYQVAYTAPHEEHDPGSIVLLDESFFFPPFDQFPPGQ
jgi:hypothetical protein